MNFKTIKNWFRSSTGDGVSRTWKGLAHSVIPYVVLFGPFVGLDVTPEDLNPIIAAVGVLIVSVWAVVSSAEVVYGLVRKFAIRLSK